MRRTYEPLPLSVESLSRVARVARSQCGDFSEADLAEAVVALSRIYTRARDHIAGCETENKSALLARAGFFFARDLPKVFGPLDELRRIGRLPAKATLRVLDVGAGLGATSLGLARYLRLRAQPTARLEVVALEQNKRALGTFGALTRALSELPDELVPLTLDAQCADLRTARIEGRFDLIVLGFVLNELFAELPADERVARRAELLTQLSARLTDGGALIVLEPALKDSTRELMRLRDRLVHTPAAPFVLAPCLHDAPCPMLASERDWCHQELPYALPPQLARVARAAGLRYEGLSYASLVLANTPREAVAPSHLRIVSDRLESKGKLELFGCGARGYVRLSRLTRDASQANAAFTGARRGDVLAIDSDESRLSKETIVHKFT